MGSNEYWAGRDLEKNQILQETIARIFSFERVDADGGTGTKGDMIGINGDQRTHISVKYASGSNTQVHLPTLQAGVSPSSLLDSLAFYGFFFGVSSPKISLLMQVMTLSLQKIQNQAFKLCTKYSLTEGSGFFNSWFLPSIQLGIF